MILSQKNIEEIAVAVIRDAKVKYNRPDELAGILEDTFTLWDAE